jgi:hypothetical protein
MRALKESRASWSSVAIGAAADGGEVVAACAGVWLVFSKEAARSNTHMDLVA